MNNVAKTFAALSLIVSGVAIASLPAQAADAPKAPDFFNSQQTAASARQNAEWRQGAMRAQDWRANVQDSDQANAPYAISDATQSQRGYGF